MPEVKFISFCITTTSYYDQRDREKQLDGLLSEGWKINQVAISSTSMVLIILVRDIYES